MTCFFYLIFSDIVCKFNCSELFVWTWQTYCIFKENYSVTNPEENMKRNTTIKAMKVYKNSVSVQQDDNCVRGENCVVANI